MKRINPVSLILFVLAFTVGVAVVDRSAAAQGVAAAISLWVNSAYVSTSNPLPVKSQ